MNGRDQHGTTNLLHVIRDGRSKSIKREYFIYKCLVFRISQTNIMDKPLKLFIHFSHANIKTTFIGVLLMCRYNYKFITCYRLT